MTDQERPGNRQPLNVRGQFAELKIPELPVIERGVWKCLPCITDRKAAELAGADALPPLRDAVTMLGGTYVCYQHITVQRQSPLQIPTNGYGG